MTDVLFNVHKCTYMTTAPDYCASCPCYNGGTCKNSANRYTCDCKTGYSGARCDLESKIIHKCWFNICTAANAECT